MQFGISASSNSDHSLYNFPPLSLASLEEPQRFKKHKEVLKIDHSESTIMKNPSERKKQKKFNLIPPSYLGKKSKEIGEEFFDKPTIFNGYYRSRILDRHRGYLNNQWWNGQLDEYSVETTFLSDIDWRTNFVGSLSSKKKKQQNPLSKNRQANAGLTKLVPFPSGKKSFEGFPSSYPPKEGKESNEKSDLLLSQENQKNPPGFGLITELGKIPFSKKTPILLSKISGLENKKEEKEDSFIDFPDFDQHYNPGNRRWVLHFGYWSYWYNFKTTHNSEIYSYMVTESFLTTFNFLNANREIIDYFVTKIIKNGLIKEISIVDGLKRF